MLRIRLCRMGSKKRPFYRLVVSDSRLTPTARVVDNVGHYDPNGPAKTLQLDLQKVDHWVSRGARPSETVERLIKRERGKTASA